MDIKEILKHVDHTLLKPIATWEDIQKICDESIEYNTASICIPSCYISRINEKYGDKVNICTVVGFPLGYSTTEAKVLEAKQAIENGANEIDMVINVSKLKDRDYDFVQKDIEAVKKACGNTPLKVILETDLLTSEEIKNMSFEDFRTQIEGMEEVQKLTADGTERYGIYKHDVCYVNRDGIERTLQMIVPETNAKAPKIYPAILYVQGSAWRKQDNYKRLGAMADLARRGFVTAILQYRESDLATFPAPVEDAKTGVRFLRKHAEEYRIDPSQVFIMGDSSGGNTAFIAGVTADQELMDTDVYGEYSCKVNAIVDFYGVTCVQIKEDFPTTLNQGEPDSPEGMLIGKKNVYEYPELSNAVTCMNYVKKETEIPPVLMMHGLADDLVAPEQSIRLYKKLREEDKEVEFYLVENAKHGDPAFWTEKNMDIVEKFLKAHMN